MAANQSGRSRFVFSVNVEVRRADRRWGIGPSAFAAVSTYALIPTDLGARTLFPFWSVVELWRVDGERRVGASASTVASVCLLITTGLGTRTRVPCGAMVAVCTSVADGPSASTGSLSVLMAEGTTVGLGVVPAFRFFSSSLFFRACCRSLRRRVTKNQ